MTRHIELIDEEWASTRHSDSPEQQINRDERMEAEQLNTISNQLQDLAARSAELRRYL